MKKIAREIAELVHSTSSSLPSDAERAIRSALRREARSAKKAERKPAAARYPTQVHYWLPHGKNPNPGKLALQQALFGVGFTWPVIEDASDSEGQHYVLECEYVNAGGAYGQT